MIVRPFFALLPPRVGRFHGQNLRNKNLKQATCQQTVWPQKCDGGPYNGADSVHWPFIYIYIMELTIYKKESGCIPPRLGDTLSDSQFDFEVNLTQSERQENCQQVATKV